MLSIELNIWIPLVGLCFLLVLIVKVIAEPRGSYSRRIYFLMLLLCAGILAMEMMQAYLDVHADSIRNSAAMNRPVYFLFYLCLIILCSCWTFYSYYWFNGHRPVGRSEAGFMVAPVAGAVLLVLNLFFGNIYRIDEVSGYMRGPMFFAFIISCYLYMLLAISLTAVTAILKDGNKRKQDLLLFLLFFIFPAIGPVLQYLLPAFSLMGVSEVIALQAVYMAVQQRSLTQHAVEMARYQDEYRSYEKTLSDLLSANTETLYFCHLNITENTRNEERVSSPYIRKQLEGVETIDELFTRIAASVVDTEEAQKFRKTFNRSSLLQNFDSQKTQIVQSFHRLTDGGKTHLVKVSLSMLRNPDSGNIEGILYSVDMNRQEKEEKVITAITDREYDYIALIDVSTKKIDYQYSSAYAVTDNGLKMGDYDTEITASLNGQSAPVLFGRVVEALAKQEEFSYFFTLSDTDRGERQKRITYRYLDEKKADILVFINDITEEISQERNRSEMLQSALREAQHASTMKTEFLSNVSHDMRTPLNAVLGYTDLARKSEDPAVMLDYLSKIDRAGRILLSLINDTLDLSKIETGVVTLKEAPISCGEVIRKVVSAIRPAMDEKHINFVIDNSRAVMATINVDALRLQEIFINLLSNAVKFTPENGTVTFVVECIGLERDCVHDRIIVRDNGCGMSREFLPKIFEPFTQERLASTKNVGGSGPRHVDRKETCGHDGRFHQRGKRTRQGYIRDRTAGSGARG
jgi:signal transduction histidine kinase